MATIWDEQQIEPQTIGGDRRGDRRYSLSLEVHWRLLYRRRVVATGSGQTRDLSSHGIFFEAGRRLAPGNFLELSVSWPVLLDGAAPMKLMASGRVVRLDGTCAAIRMIQHEFYTAGTLGQRKAPPVPAGFWNIDCAGGLLKN